MPATMQDIADACGLSMMTVSRVLAGKSCVSPATREKVLREAERLDYKFNVLAQNFARKRSGFVGIAAPFAGLIGSNYFGELMKGFQRVFLEDQREFALFDTHSPSFNDGSKLERLYHTRKVEGLLVVAPNADDKYLDTFSDLKIPLVVVGKKVTSSKVCCVGCDDYKGISEICGYLYELGHRKIAFVGGPFYFSVGQVRESAYKHFCGQRRLDLPEAYVQRGDYSMASGRAAGMELLKMRDRPTAILSANDMMAFGVMESARELRLDMPAELSVAGFDDLPTSADRFPDLTTVHQPVAEMAERSARLLKDWLENGRPPGGNITLPVSLVKRGSTAAPAAVA